MPSGTTAINCVLKLLIEQNIKTIIALPPYYFTLTHSCDSTKSIYLDVLENAYIDKNHTICINRAVVERKIRALVQANRSFNYALWITNPIYCSGHHYTEEEIQFFSRLLESNSNLFLIADECLAYNSKEVLRKLCNHKRFISILDPWKQICLNGYKFSVIDYHIDHKNFVDNWSDILSGSLPYSSFVGLTSFVKQHDVFLEHKNNANNFFSDIISEIRNGNMKEYFLLSDNTYGPYISCYIKKLSPHFLTTKNIEMIIKETGCSLIPNVRNTYPSVLGCSFRINLARFDRNTNGCLNTKQLYDVVNFILEISQARTVSS